MTIYPKDTVSFSKKSPSLKKTQIHGGISFWIIFFSVKRYKCFYLLTEMAATRRGYACPRPSHRHYDGGGERRPCKRRQLHREGHHVRAAGRKLDGDTYNMTVCPCLYPSIVCQAIDDEGPHNGATSRQIPDIMATFKLKMGISNYAILNALRKKEEMMKAWSGAATAPSSGSDTTDWWHTKQHSQ